MSPDTFGQSVLAAEFSRPVLIKREPNGFVDSHQHPFEAKALILEGQIEIGFETTAYTHHRGGIFHLTTREPHWERHGPQSVVYLSARKFKKRASAAGYFSADRLQVVATSAME